MKTISFVRVLSSIVLIGLLGIAMYYVAQPPPNLPSSTASVDAQTDPVLAQPTTPITPTQVVQVQPTTAVSIETQSVITVANATAWQVMEEVRFEGVDGKPCTPRFAPQGDDFLCYGNVEGSPHLWLASIDEGIQDVLVKDTEVNFSWSKNSQQIIYTTNAFATFSQDASVSKSISSVYVRDLRNKTPLQLGHNRFFMADLWAVDQAAFIDGTELKMISLNSRQSRIAQQRSVSLEEIIGQPQHTSRSSTEHQPDMGVYYTKQSVSLNGEWMLLYEITQYMGSNLYLVNLISGDYEYVTSYNHSPFFVQPWSSDGIRFVYTVDADSDTYYPSLWMRDVTQAEPTQLLQSEYRGRLDNVHWLAESETIFYGHRSSGASGALYVTDSSGTKPQQLITNGTVFGITQSDNQHLRVTFNREWVDGEFDPGMWITELQAN